MPEGPYHVMSGWELVSVQTWHVDEHLDNRWRRVSKVAMSHDDAVVLCERLNREAAPISHEGGQDA